MDPTKNEGVNGQLGHAVGTSYNQIFCFGNAECDQFYVDGENFESKRPVEVEFFGRVARIRIVKIACGIQHSLVLSELGQVYTWGNADDGCLGRAVGDSSTTPGLVDLAAPVDLISAGESHSVCANSKTGILFIWGTVKSSLKGKLFNHPLPEERHYYNFTHKGIQDLKSGLNHIVVLSNHKAYTWGDNDSGALGTLFRDRIEEKKIFEPNSLSLKSVTKIFVSANNTFLQNRKGLIYGCGLNNYGQLGLQPADEEEGLLRLPSQIPGLKGAEILDIVGGEHHTLVLMNDGRIYGAGRNDDGQLGEINEDDCIGCFKRLTHLGNIEKIYSANHYNYAKEKDEDALYAWGFGASYVLANGREDSLSEARKVNNEKFFTQGFPSYLSLGHSFVAFSTNPLGSRALLEEKVAEVKKRRAPRKLSKDNRKKINRSE